MGGYSEVEACCPICGQRIIIQSKAGHVEYGWYTIDNLPDSIADDINGREEKCSCCEYELEVKSEMVRKSYLKLKE